MSRGDNQSRKKTVDAVVSNRIDADEGHGTGIPISSGEQKTSTNGEAVGRSVSSQHPNKTQPRERYLAPMENQALLSMAMEISRMGAWELDRASGAVYWSPELEEIFGLEPGGFPGTRDAFYDLVHKDDRDRIVAEIETAIREHRPYSIEFRFYHVDRGIRWMEGRGEAVYSEKGEPVRVYGVGIDITDRKLAEESLRQNESDARMLQSVSAELIRQDEPQALYEKIIGAAAAIMRSDFGSMQLLLRESGKDGELKLLAFRGFDPEAAKFWESVGVDSGSSCGEAMRTGERVVVPDIEKCDFIAGSDDLATYRHTGIRSVQTTPLFSRAGELLGMISTHWREPHEPSERELRLLDILARQAADLIERRNAEETLRLSEEKYRTLFDSIDEGFLIHEMIRDETGRATDFRMLEVNSAFTRQTGLGNDTVGKLASEFMPNVERLWIDTFDRVARTGIPERVENYNQATGRWYNVHVSRAGRDDRRVAAVFHDITDRKHREEQQQFLLKFSDTLRTLPNRETIERTSLQLLAEFLSLDRAYIATVYRSEDRAAIGPEYRRPDLGLAPVSGELHMSDFPEGFRQVEEQTLVVDDIASDSTLSELDRQSLGAIDLTALVVASARKGERNVIWSLVASTNTPRKWTKDEVLLIETVAERTWAAATRARAEDALRGSEEKYRTLFDSIDEGFCTIEVLFDPDDKPCDYRFLEMNPAFAGQTGLKDATGKRMLELAPDHEKFWFETYGKIALTGEPQRFEHQAQALNRWYDVYAFRIGEACERRVAIVFNDITERKRHEKRQEYLLKLNDALRPLADPVSVEQTFTQMTMDHFAADRCYYVTVEGNDAIISRDALRGDLPSVAGTYPLTDFALFKKAIDEGRPLVVTDAKTTDVLDEGLRDLCLQLQIVSFLNIPVVKDGKAAGILCLVQSEPRTWTANEIELATETAERAWDAVTRARAEKAVRESEELFRSVFANNMVAMGIWTEAGGIINANDALLNLTGYTREELETGEINWIELTPPEYHERDLQAVAEVNAQGFCAPYEKAFRHKDGREVPIVIGGGRFGESTSVGIFFAVDITEQKQAENTLTESEERYRGIVSQNLSGIAETDLEGMFTTVNDRYCEITGYTREELLSGLRMQDVTHPDELARNVELFGRCITDGVPFEIEKRYLRKDGSAVWVHNSVSCIKDAAGKPRSLVATALDISERKQADEVRARLASIVESSDDAIISKDLNGIIMSWNRGAENLFGYTAAEVLGKSIKILIPDDYPNEEAAILKRIRRGESIDHYETIRKHKDGTMLDISLTVSPVFNADGKVVGASKIARDISESKQVESNRRLLFDISEIIRRSDRAEDLLYAVAAAAGKHFGASRCLFNEIDQDANRETVHRDYHNGVGSVAGVHRLTDYSPITSAEMANGKTVVNSDSKTDKRTADDYERTYKPASERAYVAVPMLRNGRWVASLWISQSEPRRWTAQEIGLLDTIAERTWLAVENLRSESALRRSEEQYRTLFDLVPVAVYTCDADGVITAYNRNAITLWGREPEQGERFNGSFKMYYPDGRPMPREEGPMARILNGETLEDGEDEILIERPDMARKVVIAIPKLLTDRHGNIIGGINCLYDVTELKVAQRALIRSERRAAKDYQELLQHIVPLGQKLGTARDLVTIYRAVHDFICSSMDCSAFFVSFYNPQTKLRTAAYAWGEGEEIDISLLPPMPISPEGGSNSQAILDKKSVVTNRYWDTMKDRPHVVLMENGIDPMSSLVVPMVVKNSVIGTLEVQAHEDRAFTTEHIVAMEMVANLAAVAIENVRLLEAHDKARQEAEAANRTKDEFLSVLSHELRTPLNSMMGWIRMMRLGNLDTEQTAKAIEVIDRNTRVQSSLIEDLLDVSRIISGKMRVEKELTDLTAAVKAAATAIRPIAEAKNISFDIDIATEPLFTDGDPVRLQQVATNLLQNAIKFTPEYGTISVTVTRSRTDAIIEVQDSGIGIDRDLLPNIFERFRQGDASTKRGFAGLGLGLTIVRTIVELHGGEITAMSDGKDRGSLFRVRLPLTEVLYAEDPKSDTIGEPTPADHSLEGLKILLVDDDTDSVKPLALFLQGKMAEVVTADSAPAALHELADGQFDILITDIGMPGIDGFELLGKIRSSMNGASNIPAIAVTAYASAGDRAKAVETGFQHHLAKPIDYEELLKAVKSLRVGKVVGG